MIANTSQPLKAIPRTGKIEPLGQKGGGVFIFAKDNIESSEQKHLKTNCEILWVKIDLACSKSVYMASYYRQHEDDTLSASESRKSVDMTSKLKGNIWILGDFNYPKLCWDSDLKPSIKPGCGHTQLYEDFIDLLDDFSLTKMINVNTRGDSTLDLFLTRNHTLVSSVQVIQGISDHGMVVYEINCKASINNQPPRQVFLYRNA